MLQMLLATSVVIEFTQVVHYYRHHSFTVFYMIFGTLLFASTKKKGIFSILRPKTTFVPINTMLFGVFSKFPHSTQFFQGDIIWSK